MIIFSSNFSSDGELSLKQGRFVVECLVSTTADGRDCGRTAGLKSDLRSLRSLRLRKNNSSGVCHHLRFAKLKRFDLYRSAKLI